MRNSKWIIWALANLAFMSVADAQSVGPAADSIEGHLAAGKNAARRGLLNNSSRPFHRTLRRNGCIAIATASTARASAGAEHAAGERIGEISSFHVATSWAQKLNCSPTRATRGARMSVTLPNVPLK